MKIFAYVSGPTTARKVGDRMVYSQMGYAMPRFPEQHPSIPVQVECKADSPFNGTVLLSYKIASGKYDSLVLPEWAFIGAVALSQQEIDIFTQLLEPINHKLESSGSQSSSPSAKSADVPDSRMAALEESNLRTQQLLATLVDKLVPPSAPLPTNPAAPVTVRPATVSAVGKS